MSELKETAQYINEKYPNSPLPGRVLRLVSMMKIHKKQEVSAEECRAALEEE